MKAKRLRVAQIYKIIYPNGKIYIGQDRTADINYFGSADSATIAKDFSATRRLDLTIRKQILATLRMVTIKRLNNVERAFIRKFGSSNPRVGYNRTHGQKRTIMRETTV